VLVLATGVCGLAWLVASFDVAPVLASLVLLSLATVLVMWPELATLLMVFLLYVNFPAILTKVHGIPEAIAGSFVLLLGLPLVQLVIVGRQRLRTGATFYLMLLLLAVYAASALGAIDKSIAVGRIQLYLLEGLLLLWLVVNVVRRVGTLRRVIWAVLAAGSLLSLLCIYQDVTGDYDQEFGGLAYRNFQMGEGEGPPKSGRSKWDRAQGPVNEPNRFAQIMVVLLPLAVMMHRTGRSRPARLAAAAAGLLILAGTMLTLSRGAFVTLLLMTLAMAGLKWIRSTHLATGVVVLLLAVPVVSPYFIPRVLSILNAGAIVFGDTADYQQADGAMLGRTTAMLTAFRVFRDYPVLGVGLGQFGRFYSLEYSRDPDVNFRDLRGPRRAHTLYLEIAAETGALGLVVFLSIVGLLLRRLWALRRVLLERDPGRADLAAALCMSLLTYLCTAVFLHLSYQRYYWLLVALGSAAVYVLGATHLRSSADGAERHPHTSRLVSREVRWLPSR
jgi:putative inorganic carbon (hco3(-)) transporter